jgi:trehalose-phosphatase
MRTATDHSAATLSEQIAALAREQVLLVGADFDGTLAPIVTDPAAATGREETLAPLRTLSSLARTHVAIISGRALADLSARVGSVERAHLVGSHGSEFQSGFARPLDKDAAATLAEVAGAAQEVAAATTGSLVELKPASVAFHYRNVDPKLGAERARMLLDRVGQRPGVHVRHGKCVVEFSVVQGDKGTALATLRRWVGATAVFFIGDDVTDEDAFAGLHTTDLGVKVGTEPTAAAFRVADPENVGSVLQELAGARAAWVASQGW